MSNFIRQYANAMPDDLCETLIAWFDSVEDVKTVKADRITRKDEQKWLTFDQHSDLYTRVQKYKYDMMHRYKEEFPFCYRGSKKLISPDIKVQRTPPFGGGFHNWHAEVSHHENMDRCLVWSFYLNDVELEENIRGEDVFVIQSTSYPANDNLMELLVALDALRRASARRITAVMPYFGGSLGRAGLI